MGTMPGEKGVRTSNHISKRGQFQEQNDQHIQKQGMKRFMCPKRDDCGQEGIHMSKKGQFQGKKWSAHPKMGQEGVRVSKKGQYRARNGRHVQKGGRKVSVCPKRDKKGQHRARKGWHVQKQGRKGFVCPKKDDSRREGVGTSKNGAGRGSCVQKGAISGEK